MIFCISSSVVSSIALHLLSTGLVSSLLGYSEPACLEGDPRASVYQYRPQMDRCEGIRVSRPIAAIGLRLASYSIGIPQVQRRQEQGQVLSLQVPAPGADQDVPAVTVQARGGKYLMTPLRLGTAHQGWRSFSWGSGVIKREGIQPIELRATALLRQPGDADQWLPVKFTTADVYSLVIASNGALPVANVRILGPGRRFVKECSGPTRLETELLCRWDGRNDPAGIYRLVARSAEGGGELLNMSLRHDPRWLSR
jgi:hypothetical protein